MTTNYAPNSHRFGDTKDSGQVSFELFYTFLDRNSLLQLGDRQVFQDISHEQGVVRESRKVK